LIGHRKKEKEISLSHEQSMPREKWKRESYTIVHDQKNMKGGGAKRQTILKRRK
jgi:hypothetical protein